MALRNQSIGSQAPSCVHLMNSLWWGSNLRDREWQLLPYHVKYSYSYSLLFIEYVWEERTKSPLLWQIWINCSLSGRYLSITCLCEVETPEISTYRPALKATFGHSTCTFELVTLVFWWDCRAPFNPLSYQIRHILFRELHDNSLMCLIWACALTGNTAAGGSAFLSSVQTRHPRKWIGIHCIFVSLCTHFALCSRENLAYRLLLYKLVEWFTANSYVPFAGKSSGRWQIMFHLLCHTLLLWQQYIHLRQS